MFEDHIHGMQMLRLSELAEDVVVEFRDHFDRKDSTNTTTTIIIRNETTDEHLYENKFRRIWVDKTSDLFETSHALNFTDDQRRTYVVRNNFTEFESNTFAKDFIERN